MCRPAAASEARGPMQTQERTGRGGEAQAARPLVHAGSSGSQGLSAARHPEQKPHCDWSRVESAPAEQTRGKNNRGSNITIWWDNVAKLMRSLLSPGNITLSLLGPRHIPCCP